MSYSPDFRQNPDYQREKASIRSLEEWLAFKIRRLSFTGVPEKSPEHISRETDAKRGLTKEKLGGRAWYYWVNTWNIPPEAVYEEALACYAIGLRFEAPELFHGSRTRQGDVYWSQECAFCGIGTLEVGDIICPVCGRELIFKIHEQEAD